MYKKFLPQYYYKNIYDIEYDMLEKKGVKGLIFDLDNTICSYATTHPTKEILSFIEGLQTRGFSVFIVSNNSKARVTAFNESMGLDIIYRAQKPFKGAILRAAKKMGYAKEEIALIGDQIYTDVWGGNRVGVTTVLVEPVEEKESVFFKLKRKLEMPVIRHFEKNRRP